VSPRAPWHKAHHPPGKGFDVTTCPEAPCAPPSRKGLRCCHVPRGTEPITHQERASESPRALRLQVHPLCRKTLVSPRDRDTRTIARQGSGITTYPVPPDPPSGVGGLQSRHVPSGSRPPDVPVHFQGV
jgi:hypothetical protein